MRGRDPEVHLRITFVLPQYPSEPIGGFRVVYEYASRLAARGHRVTAVHAYQLRQHRPPPPDSPRAAVRRSRAAVRHALRLDRGMTWHRLHPDVRLTYVPDLRARHIPAADAVIATAWQTAEEVAGYPAAKGEPFYLIQHHELWSGDRARVDATWRLPLHKMVITSWLKELAAEIGASDVVHIPNGGVDHSHFRLTRPIVGRPPRVAMLYSSHGWKGTDDGVRALRLAKAEVPELAAVLFGASPPPDDLPEWVTVRRLPAPELLVEEVYNGSSIYLCPSLAEGWHLPPAEAMACGCALVSTDIGGVRDYAEQESNALLCPPGDAEALAAAVVRLARDAGLRERLAERGRRTIEGFDYERSTSALEQHLRRFTPAR